MGGRGSHPKGFVAKEKTSERDDKLRGSQPVRGMVASVGYASPVGMTSMRAHRKTRRKATNYPNCRPEKNNTHSI